jgi:hypothetical protein
MKGEQNKMNCSEKSNIKASMPMTVAVDSKNNNWIRVISDTTDAEGVRSLEIQTTASGNNREGYKAAERHAHSWFFVNYDANFGVQELDPVSGAKIAVGLTERAIKAGYLNRAWLECPHPVITVGSEKFMFGHHCGINPTETEPTWGFHFEILPMGASD